MANPPLKLARSVAWRSVHPQAPYFDLTPIEAGKLYAKLIYEFWGFCINGGHELFEPGGFASGSVDLPTALQSGSHICAVGSDGVTEFGRDGEFLSNSFDFEQLHSASNLSKMHLVMWKSGSSSPDDSIYSIDSVVNPNTLRLDQYSGGGTVRLGNRPTFEERSGINFRIIDLGIVQNVSVSNGQGMTLTFEGAPEVNPGQARSQMRIAISGTAALAGTTGAENVNTSWVFTASPSGSWDPVSSSFSDPSSSSYVRHTGPRNGTSGNPGINDFGRLMSVTLLGARDFLIFHVKSYDADMHDGPFGSGFHVEIPKRLLGAEYDPNPICWMHWYDREVSTLPGADELYYRGMFMVGADNLTRKWKVGTRNPFGGDRIDPLLTAVSGGVWHALTTSHAYTNPTSSLGPMTYNSFDNTELSSDGILYLDDVPGQFSMARARLRRVRFTGRTRQRPFRLGQEWFLIDQTVAWPWDNAIVPLRLFEGID
jgi:hypothetical protein